MDFINETSNSTYGLKKLFVAIAQTTFKELRLENRYEFALTIISDEKMQTMNHTYRNINKTTDVLSFAMEDEGIGEIGLIRNKKMPIHLGDIFISYQKALDQAKEYQHSFKREISFLFVHGLLHLLGFDHMEQKDEKEMFFLQDKILELLEIVR